MDVDSDSAKSLEPVPQPSETSSISRFEWLDLDPLGKVKVDEAHNASGGPQVEESGTAKDPWDAVLQDEPEGVDSSSPPTEVRSKVQASSQPRRASTGAAITRSQSLHTPTTSTSHSSSIQVREKLY